MYLTKKILFTVLSLLFLFACASKPQQHDGSLSQYNRVSQEGSLSNSGMPNFLLPDWKQIQSTLKGHKRAPASVETNNSLAEMSSKRLYFLTLLQQYYDLKKLTGKEDEIKSCPVFHHDIIAESEKKNLFKEGPYESVVLTPLRSISKQKWHLFPEYHLAKKNSSYISEATLSEDTLSVWREYIGAHQARVKDELKELCEYGLSDNFYIFENYIRYLSKHEKFENSLKAFKSALKIPVVANMYLLRPVFGANSGQIKLNLYDREVLSRLKVQWLRDVLYNIARHRYSEERQRIVLRENK